MLNIFFFADFKALSHHKCNREESSRSKSREYSGQNSELINASTWTLIFMYS